MNKVKLKDIADYSDTRIKCSNLSFENFVGTDNILQNKQGKINSQYTPNSGSTTEYKKNDILIANIRPYLKKIWYATNDGGSSTDVLTIRINSEKFLPRFIYYNLFQDVFFDFVMKGSKGSRMPRGDKKQILDFPICNFDIPTQSATVCVLSSIDDKIELNNKINKDLENLAKTIYEYWFVQNADKRWEKKKIGDLLKKYTDNSLHIDAKNIYKTGKYPVITQDVGDLIKGYTNEENPIIDLPSIIFGDHSCTLRFINFPFFRGADGTQLLYFENEETTIYTYYCLEKIIPFLPNFGKYERHFKYLKDFEIDVPPTPFLLKFKKIVSPFFSTIIKNRQENAYLAQLRDFLLPLLINGQVKVKIKNER